MSFFTTEKGLDAGANLSMIQTTNSGDKMKNVHVVKSIEEEIQRITNRHVAKILFRLDPLNIPEIASAEIKRQMWFLSNDIVQAFKTYDKGRS